MSFSSFACVAAGALYPGVHRGLSSDILSAHALRGQAYPVCTAIAMAGHGVVTDFTEVPEDTIIAQLEHLEGTVSPPAMKIGVLGNHGAVAATFDAAERWQVPTVLDLQISGPNGETVLSQRGVRAILDRLGVPDLLLIDNTDAELVSGGEIHSLDDAQVAAQRLVKLGARAVLLKCGALRTRHFGQDSTRDALPYSADLFFDGEEFALFEAPYFPSAPPGASSPHALAVLRGLQVGKTMEHSLRDAKAFVSEALRRSFSIGGEPSLAYFWGGELSV